MSRRAARNLLVLGIMIVLFAAGISPLVSLIAAVWAGMAALQVSSATQSLLYRQDPRRAASVMALWAIAWAGSKPLASLADGWLANGYSLRIAGAALSAPAIILALLEMYLPKRWKKWIKGKTSALIDRWRPGRRSDSSSNAPRREDEMAGSGSGSNSWPPAMTDGSRRMPPPSLMNGMGETHDTDVSNRSLSMYGSSVT